MSCCTFSVFMDDFNHYFPQYFDVPPSAQQLKMARSDWRAGNTGYEAAHKQNTGSLPELHSNPAITARVYDRRKEVGRDAL